VTRLVRIKLLLGAIVWAALLIVGYLLLVNTAWGHTVDNAAFSGRRAIAHAIIDYDRQILGAVSMATVALAALVILFIGVTRSTPLVAIIAATGFACAVVGAEFLKHSLPWHALVPSDANLAIQFQRGTYPSAHTTIGTSLVIALLLVSSARWRPWLAVLAGFMSASFATGVVFGGWHRPSDALGGIVWSGLCMSIAAVTAVVLRGREIQPIQSAHHALLGSATLAIVFVAIAWLSAAGSGDEYPDAYAPFLILTLFIVAGSFSVCAWFGWQLRGLDWRRPRKT
jgi:hypothetical protein